MTQLYVVIQEGGTSRELYVHAFDSLKEARVDIKGCQKASYRTAGPIKLDPELSARLLADKTLEGLFYSQLKTVLEAVANNLQ